MGEKSSERREHVRRHLGNTATSVRHVSLVPILYDITPQLERALYLKMNAFGRSRQQ